MDEIKLENFDGLVKSLKKIKDEIVTEKSSKGRNERAQKITQWITLAIAVLSFSISVYTVLDNNSTDTRNYAFQRETQAYSFWLDYLKLANEKSEMANGMTVIDGISIQDLACRDINGKHFKPSTIRKFEDYAWFVSNALGHVEVVADLIQKDDKAWLATIDTVIGNHIDYISCACFRKDQYSDFLQAEIDKVIALRCR